MKGFTDYLSIFYPDYKKGLALRIHFLCSLLAVPCSIFVYWLVVAVMPTFFMVTISGTLEDTAYISRYSPGRMGGHGSTHSYFKLDNYNGLIVAEESSGRFLKRICKNKPQINDRIEVYIYKKDLPKVTQVVYTKPLKEYEKEELWNGDYPRFYGLKINGKVIVSPQNSVWNYGTFSQAIGAIILLMFWIICFISIMIGYNMIKNEINNKTQDKRRKHKINNTFAKR